MERMICLHGHFYQPPRENPWLEAIELQDSAYPYHDWNARITEECYGPNARSRILDGEGRIVEIVNNYSRISFNFGPTILAWLEASRPDVYEAIRTADRESQERFSGHGSALAQAYNHMILPLANPRDRRTQIRWGIRDFERRFGRRPEGMWLPETAVDLDTLEALAEQEIHYTLLEPGQASAVREIGVKHWHDVRGGRIDPTRAYLQRLPSGRKIVLFFYDGPISRAVAFEQLLSRGERLANRLLGAFSDTRQVPQLVHVATDGETYGHHHVHGDMALAYALRHIGQNGSAGREEGAAVRLTNYGEFLERNPPTHEVRIVENTSWSCVHGIERWRGDCGCSTGGSPEWSQEWRGPLRAALDWLRDAVEPRYEQFARELFRDPWAARDDYVDVLLDRSRGSVDRWLAKQAGRELDERQTVVALRLLELQRHAMLMYTSCGWFFSELSGIETVQVLQYAGRVVQLGQDLFGDRLEDGFLERLEAAKSNLDEHRDGRHIYETMVRPSAVDLRRVGAHYAVSSLFAEREQASSQIYCYTVEDVSRRSERAGAARLVVGVARVRSRITFESELFTYAALHFGDHNVAGGVHPFKDDEEYEALAREATEVFQRADLAVLIRLLDRTFGGYTFTLRSLFRDEQRKVVGTILKGSIRDTESTYRQLYERRAPLLRFVTDLGMPVPRPFQAAAEIVVNAQLRKLVESDKPNLTRINALIEEARAGNIPLDGAGLGYALRETTGRLARALRAAPSDLVVLRRLTGLATLARTLPFGVNLWEVQNRFYDVIEDVYPEQRRLAAEGDEAAGQWVDAMEALSGPLNVAVPREPR